MGKLLARFLALLLATLFVPLTVGIVFYQAAGTRLTRADCYKETLDRANFYSRTPRALADALAAGLDKNFAAAAERENAPAGLPEFLRGLSPEDWERLLATAMPPSLLRNQGEGAIDQFFTFMDSPDAPPSLRIDFVALKGNLASPAMQDAYLRLLASKPPAPADTPPQILPFSQRPPDTQLPEIRARFAHAAAHLASRIPDSRDLLAEAVEADRSGSTRAALDFLREKASHNTRIASWSPLLPALVLLAIGLLAVRSVRGFLLWLGIPCLLAGALGVLLSLPSADTTHWLVVTFLSPLLPTGMPVHTLDLVVSVLTAAMDLVLGAAFRHSAWLGLGGLAAVTLSFGIPRTPPAKG